MNFEYHPNEAKKREMIEAPRSYESPFVVGEEPVITSMGVTATPKGWVFFLMHTKGDKVISVEYGQDNMKSTCVEQFKISAQKHFME